MVKDVIYKIFYSFFSEEDGLSKTEANLKVELEIARDPENTICEKAWWLFYGWTIKCMRSEFRGLSCGAGTHIVEYSRNKYIYRHDVLKELEAKE